MDFNKLIARAKAILLSPATEWPVIADEQATVSEIFKNYVLWLAAIAAVAGFIANTIVGYSVPFLGTYRIGFGAGLTGAVTTYVLSLAGVFLVAYLADVLAPTFGGQKNFTQAVKVVAYAYTASWIAAVGLIVPGLRWLILLAGAAYSIYLFHLGLPYTMKCPPEKAWRYTAITIVAAVIVRWLVGIVAADIGGVGYAGYVPRTASRSASFDASTPAGKLQRWAQGAALGGNAAVEALAPDRMRGFLPASLGSLARSQVSAERHAVLGMQLSEAEAQYNDEQGHSIDLKISDTGGASGLLSLASWAAFEEVQQTPTGYEKTYKSGDRIVHEEWKQPEGQSAMGSGEYAVIVGQRYAVQATGRVPDMDTLRSAVTSVDLAGLESLKNEGVRAN